MMFPAIKKVLAQYRSSPGVVTQEMITAAWIEVGNAEDRFRSDLTPESKLEWHLAEAHWHILRARDVIYGTGEGGLKRGRYIRFGLNKINNILFKVQRQNRKEQK